MKSRYMPLLGNKPHTKSLAKLNTVMPPALARYAAWAHFYFLTIVVPPILSRHFATILKIKSECPDSSGNITGRVN